MKQAKRYSGRRIKPKQGPRTNGAARKHKTAAQIAAEQGIGPVTNPDDIIGKAADLWTSDEEFHQFVKDIYDRRRQDTLR